MKTLKFMAVAAFMMLAAGASAQFANTGANSKSKTTSVGLTSNTGGWTTFRLSYDAPSYSSTKKMTVNLRIIVRWAFN